MATRIKKNFAGIEFSGYDKNEAGVGIPRAAFERILRNDQVNIATHFGIPMDGADIQKLLDQKVTGPILLKDDKIVFKPTSRQEVFEITLKTE